MSAKKVANLAVKTGSYVKDGQAKPRYKNCGIVLQKEDGGKMLMIDPTFNFAAIRLDEGRDYIILSEFEVKDAPAQQSTPQFEE